MIDILGTGLTLDSYDWSRPSFKWGLSQYLGAYKGEINLYFAMHEDQSKGIDNEIGLESYPLKEIQEWSGSSYFTSSTAYMIAYAIYTGEKEIHLFGIDMENKEEYKEQRSCVAYWIGFGLSRGIKVTTATGLTEPPYIYGYDTKRLGKMTEALENRISACNVKAKETTDKEQQQWLGAGFAYSKVIEQIRS